MNELYETYLELRTEAGTIDRGRLEEMARQFNPEAAVYLLQATDRAVLGPLKDFDQGLEGCFSLIICDLDAELRLSKEPFKGEARWRWLREHADRPAAAERYWGRRDCHPLRQPFKAPHAALTTPSGQGWLEAREYFQPDKDGWLTWRFTRLAGLAREGR